MVSQSYGKAEPCLTSGGGAPNPPAIGFAQTFCSGISQIYQRRFNGSRLDQRKPLETGPSLQDTYGCHRAKANGVYGTTPKGHWIAITIRDDIRRRAW